MSGKEYTSYNLFFIHHEGHEGHEVYVFSSCSSCLRGEKIMRNSGMFFHGNGLKPQCKYFLPFVLRLLP